jgi:hypothetical protein
MLGKVFQCMQNCRGCVICRTVVDMSPLLSRGVRFEVVASLSHRDLVPAELLFHA